MKLPKQLCFELFIGPYCTFDDDLAIFLSRAVSHICAPGFFYTMGVGVAIFTLSRTRRGWSRPRLVRHFALRGFILVLMDRILCTAQNLANCAAQDALGVQCVGGATALLSFFQVFRTRKPCATATQQFSQKICLIFPLLLSR